MDSNSVILIFVVLYSLAVAASLYYFHQNDMLERNFLVMVLGISAVILAVGIFGFINENLLWLIPCAALSGVTGALLVSQSARIGYVRSNPELVSNGERLSNKEIDAMRTSDVIVRKVSLGLSKNEFSEGTMERLEKAITINPSNAEAYHILAYLSVEHGSMEDALNYVNRALEIDPDNGDYLDLLDYINDNEPSLN